VRLEDVGRDLALEPTIELKGWVRENDDDDALEDV
jgi:hypothetical protein